MAAPALPTPSFISDQPDATYAEARKLKSPRRPWVVCCYAPIGAQFSHAEHIWKIPKQRPRKVLLWKLIDFKVFATRTDAFNSRSYQRGYSPFNHKNVLVVLRHNKTIMVARRLGTIGLY